MKKILTITILLFLHKYSFGQEKYNPLYPPNTYQNEDNPNYWKNKKPYADYWQQDVHYKIKATINEETDIISAQQIFFNQNLILLNYSTIIIKNLNMENMKFKN